MSSTFTGSAQEDLPEVIEEYLEHGVMKCIAFNRRGTLLAAGCDNGSCIIWDFETRMIAKELKDEDCTATITSVCWSKYGRHILISTADKKLILWEVVTGKKVAQITLEKLTLRAHLHPDSSTPSLCLANPVCSAPVIVDLNQGTITSLPVSLPESADGLSLPIQNNISDESASQNPVCFNKQGGLVYLGNSKGEVLIVDHCSFQVCAVVSVAGGAVIKNIVFSRNGQFLLTNSSDRTIRVYKNVLSVKDGLKALHKMGEVLNDLGHIEKMKALGSNSLLLYHEFEDSISRTPWKSPCFNKNGEWIISGSANKGEHKICIWSQTGHLAKILVGPNEALIDVAWHPLHPVIVSLSVIGLVYIWAKLHSEDWSAFSPKFKEIEVCEEYTEREDEFDTMPETQQMKQSEIDPDEEVDIITVESDKTFSDSELSEEELCFLPAIPCPNTPEKPHEFSGDAKVSRLAVDQDAFSVTGCVDSNAETGCASRLGRLRRPSVKILEFRAEKAKKRTRSTSWQGFVNKGIIQFW